MRQGEGKRVANSPAAYSRGAKNPAEGEDAGLRPPLLLKTALRWPFWGSPTRAAFARVGAERCYPQSHAGYLRKSISSPLPQFVNRQRSW